VRFSVLGEFSGFTLNYEENDFGGIWIYAFLELWAGSHVGLLRRGDPFRFLLCFWGNLRCWLGVL
jgi:hypothetical protein